MKNMSKLVREYERRESEISRLNAINTALAHKIVAYECPFVIGQRVRWKYKDAKTWEYWGIIYSIRFDGINSDRIDSKWEICVTPTKKDFSPSKKHFSLEWFGSSSQIYDFEIIKTSDE